MRSVLAFLALVGSCSAMLVGVTPAHAVRVAASPAMACNGGKGGSGGMAPKKDKDRRGKLKKLLYVVSGLHPAAQPPLRQQQQLLKNHRSPRHR